MSNNILVSCTVLTYNSSKTVIETLDSIKAQTYPYIELIVSDDCSLDDTVKLCRQWIETNKERFVRTLLIEVDRNTGVSANANRLCKACKGEWRTLIGADDKLCPTCVSDYISFVKTHPDAEFIFGRVSYFGDMGKAVNVAKSLHYGFFYLKSRQQYLRLLLGMQIPTPTAFSKLSLYNEIGGYDENIPMIEDWPFWLKVIKRGTKTYFLNKVTVNYRMHESLSLSKEPSPKFIESQKLMKNFVKSLQIKENWCYRMYSKDIDNMSGKGLSTVLARVVHFLNPYTWYMLYLRRKMEHFDRKLDKEFQKN